MTRIDETYVHEIWEFAMRTIIDGRWRISTVGGPTRAHHPMQIPVGFNRVYETMVFDGLSSGADIDMDGYQTEEEARAGHERMVQKVIRERVPS